MSILLTPQLHPGVPITLHPGVERPPFAAGREALSALYRTYAALEDAEHHRAAPVGEAELERTLEAVEQCLAELRTLTAAREVVSRIEQARDRLLRRWKGGHE